MRKKRSLNADKDYIAKPLKNLFITALKTHLYEHYPLHRDNNTDDIRTTHMFFPDRLYYLEVIPFLVMFSALFGYVYFSCYKIELVRSKFGIALSAILTVMGAIAMSLGLSSLSLNLKNKVYLVPYLIAFISLENILVLTRSIASTPSHFDVKIRVAHGLWIEGWNITKSLFMEITILTLGFFSGIMDPSIQEFCLLAVMGILSDFFLRNFFFVTILSLDMSIHDDFPDSKQGKFQIPTKTSIHGSRILGPSHCSQSSSPPSKRVRLMYFWAQRRIFQRLFSLCMILWIMTFVYQHTGFIQFLLKKTNHDEFIVDVNQHINNSVKGKKSKCDLIGPSNPYLVPDIESHTTMIQSLENHNLSAILSADSSNRANKNKPSKSLNKLRHSSRWKPWLKLPYTHWPMLFGLYNISLFGRYITLLPPISLSIAISPESAIRLRPPSPNEAWNTVEYEDNEDSGDDEDDDPDLDHDDHGFPELNPFVPTSPGELFIISVFICPSLIFVIYIMVVFYRIVCTRNYSEWRSSWFTKSSSDFNKLKILGNDVYTRIIQESIPMSLEGHSHEIDVLHCDGNFIISMCLNGTIYTWDSYSGAKRAVIDRLRYFNGINHNGLRRQQRLRIRRQQQLQLGSRRDQFPDFSHTINTNFLHRKEDKITSFHFSKFQDIQKKFEALEEVGDENDKEETESAVWTLDCSDGLIFMGCSDGGVEVWEAATGAFVCAYDDAATSSSGITHVKTYGKNQVIAARLSGALEFLKLSSIYDKPPSLKQSQPRRCHVQNQDNEFSSSSSTIDNDSLQLRRIYSTRAHLQPLTCLEIGGGKIMTGSQDHTLRVFRFDDETAIYTLHGHCGPITATFIDFLAPFSAGSGSQDGMLCMWDLLTGACVYSIEAHDGPVLSLAYSPSYVISMGGDFKLCVWERFQGHLINSINLMLFGGVFSQDLIMLTHNLLVTSRQGTLIVWDARLSDPVKVIKLGDRDLTHSVQILKHSEDAIVCNYGNQLRIIHFPTLSDKMD